LKIDSFIARIIKAPNVDHFSPTDVRLAYLALKNDPSLDPDVVRRKVYTELVRLEKKGWLKKSISSKKGITRFSKTSLFDEKNLFDKTASDTSPVKQSQVDKQQSLVAKLNHYKADLLLNIGETEAYKELYSELPELVDEIQPQFNEARDNNTRILGKIKAIEGLLKQNNSVEKL